MDEPPVEADPIVQLMLQVEESVNQEGWDEPPMLCTVHWILGDDRQGIRMIPHRSPEPMVPAFLHHVVQHIEQHEDDVETLMHISEDPCIGFAYLFEAWTRYGITAEELHETTSKGTSLADMVGSQEARTMLVVDIWGRAFQVVRVRGEKPHVEFDGVQPFRMSGGVVTVLARFARAVAKRHPAQYVDLPRLETLCNLDRDGLIANFKAQQAGTGQ